ncbi:CDP-glycerol glycerophosphotransferase family protein [Nocardioides sp.]|uniref:CDP-glycerol glycerophosphotransferase family protein n=1 Tax=Nocardioides sp. TaxID=35761 RepID=UPI0035279582
MHLPPRKLTQRTKLRLLQWGLRVAPTRRRAVVAGTPDLEGNSVEVVRALASRMPVRWLVSAPAEELAWLLDGVPRADRVELVSRRSTRALVSYLTSSHVFFTHGLYGSPQPPRRKTFVNLWHGDGPKRRKGFAAIRSSYIVGGTELWGRRRGDTFGVGQDRVLVTGNPRIDQLARPTDADALAALGLDPARPLVLWLPTYRRTRYRGRRLGDVRNWADGQELSRAQPVQDILASAADCAADLGITLTVKPHPLDADRFRETGLTVLTDEDLLRARTTLYSLLGRTAGLVTDYSSVWTDYLAADRPIGYFCPDLEDYDADRGLNVVDYRSVMAGPLLETPGDFADFLASCLQEGDEARAHRHAIARLVGAETHPGATERLLHALGL